MLYACKLIVVCCVLTIIGITMAHISPEISITFSINQSDSTGTIFVKNKVHKTLIDENFNGSFIDVMNVQISNCKLSKSENLESPMKAEYYRAIHNFKKLKGGVCRAIFDEQGRTIRITRSEFVSLLNTVSEHWHEDR